MKKENNDLERLCANFILDIRKIVNVASSDEETVSLRLVEKEIVTLLLESKDAKELYAIEQFSFELMNRIKK